MLYHRTINHELRIHSFLTIGKSRLTQQQSITIQDFQLSAAKVVVKLDWILKQELELRVVRSAF